jgi:hypothetical protein
MSWARMLAYITGTVDQDLLLGNEYLAAENLWYAKIPSGSHLVEMLALICWASLCLETPKNQSCTH